MPNYPKKKIVINTYIYIDVKVLDPKMLQINFEQCYTFQILISNSHSKWCDSKPTKFWLDVTEVEFIIIEGGPTNTSFRMWIWDKDLGSIALFIDFKM